MKRIVTDSSSFERLITEGCVYVDKTALLARLASGRDGSQFFLARPRRFGKSLLLSTLKCLFEGRRELFKGLKIDRMRWDWAKTYPVVMLNLSEVGGLTPAAIEPGLYSLADDVARQFGLQPKPERQAGKFFSNVLGEMTRKYGSFVVLVDEYDVPLQGFLSDRKAIVQVRKILHDFYVPLKNHAGAIRFLLITGVTKLAKLSLFSGLNNPIDLTLDAARYAGLLGYTPHEIAIGFAEHLARLAKKRKCTPADLVKKLREWYDSYRFCPDSTVRVCNPVSVGKALQSGKFQSYWPQTASASLLVERMRVLNASLRDFEEVTATRDELDVCDALEMPLVPLAYQSGYLSIKGLSRTERDAYGAPKLVLGIPNREVRGALRGAYWDRLMQISETTFTGLARSAAACFARDDLEGLLDLLLVLYAKLPPTWTPRSEADAKRYFLLFMEMAGARIAPEVPSFRGYADAVVETPRRVCVFEFKYGVSAAAAIRQIRTRGYAEPYAAGSRAVTLVGLKFDPRQRTLAPPRIEAF